MFADDTNMFFSENCNERVFQVANAELKSVDNWLTANKLSLNINKTNYIMFRTPHGKLPNQHTLQLRKKDIKRVASLKFLGIVEHQHLSWKPHMEALLKKIRTNCSVVNKIRNHLSQRILLLLLVFVVIDSNSSSILLQEHFKILLFTSMSISVLSIVFFFNRY